MRNVDLATSNRYTLYGGDNLQVDVKINPCVEDVEVLITAEKKTQFVNDLVEVFGILISTPSLLLLDTLTTELI